MRTVRTASALALCMPQGVTLEGLAYLTPTHPNPNQGVTLEGWAYLMYAVQDGYNYYASALFFFVVVGSGCLHPSHNPSPTPNPNPSPNQAAPHPDDVHWRGIATPSRRAEVLRLLAWLGALSLFLLWNIPVGLVQVLSLCYLVTTPRRC